MSSAPTSYTSSSATGGCASHTYSPPPPFSPLHPFHCFSLPLLLPRFLLFPFHFPRSWQPWFSSSRRRHLPFSEITRDGRPHQRHHPTGEKRNTVHVASLTSSFVLVLQAYLGMQQSTPGSQPTQTQQPPQPLFQQPQFTGELYLAMSWCRSKDT